MTVYLKQLFFTSGTSITLPTDWNPYCNLVECYASGASGTSGTGTAGSGGGGGAYAATSNLNVAAGTAVNIGIGTPGGVTDTWFNATSLANAIANGVSVSVGAKGAAGTTGGASAASIGQTVFSGGNGGSGGGSGVGGGGGGGGGAAGPNG